MISWNLIEDVMAHLNTYLCKFGVSCHYCSSGFEYDYNSNSIGISLVLKNWNINAFANVIAEYNPSITADAFIWLLYHEIGHSQTMNSIGSKQNKSLIEIKHDLYLKTLECNSFEEYNALYSIYANLDDEKKATDWAVNYIEDNTDEVRELWETIQPLLVQFYKENDIEGED